MPATTVKRTAVVDAEGHTLRGDAAASYLRMLAAGMPAGGVDVFMRTMAEQEALYQRYLHGGTLAARPSLTAPHIDGRAMDLHTTATNGAYDPSAAHKWMMLGGIGSAKPIAGEKLRAHDYGWFRTVPSERWHFEYKPAADKRRAADLATRLASLGYPTVAAFQAAHGLTADGVDGPMTWAALLGAVPVVPPVTPPTPEPVGAVDFRNGSLNVQSRRWGGGPYSTDAAFVKGTLRPSVLFLQEAEESARDAVVASTGMKVWPHLYLGVLWLDSHYDHGDKFAISFGTPYHGAVATRLTSKANGQSFVACSVHIRPRDAFGSDAAAKAGKRNDIARVIAMLSGYTRVTVGGDWSSDAKAQMVAAGYTMATPHVDTYDKAGEQRLDGIFVRGLPVRGGSVTPTGASDHHGLLANLTIPAPIPTN